MTDATYDDAAYADEIRSSQRRVQTVERKSVLTYRVIMAVLLAISILAFVPVNTVHNFQYFEGILGTIEGGTGDYLLYFILAGALVVVSAGLWMLLPQTEGWVWGLCFAFALGAGFFSHYASYLSLDRQAVAAIQQETADSNRSKIAMMGVEAMKAQVEAAAANSRIAGAAVENLTSQYGGWDAASVGEVNRNQLPGLTAAQSSAGLQLGQASRAMERAMQMAQDVADGAGEGATAGVFKDLGEALGWTPEGTRVFTNAFGSGVISWVPLIVTFVMGAVAFRDPDADTKPQKSEGDGDDIPQPSRVMPSSATGATDTIRGPILDDPIEVEDDGPRPMFAPRRTAPQDRTPDNKRQAAYSKKLATLKEAIGPGKTIEPGQGVTVEAVQGLVGGNRETIAALRRDVASSGLAHWQGKRLIAGAA